MTRPQGLLFGALFYAVICPASSLVHYSYHGDNPSSWTQTSLERSATAVSSDFTVVLGEPGGYRIAQIVADAAGNTYVAGDRLFQTVASSGVTSTSDVFVIKLDPLGHILFLVTMGGKGSDHATSIAVDRDGNVYVAGSTTSPNFPLRNALSTSPSGSFLAKLSADGSRIVYSTYYYGASGVVAVALDSGGYAYVATNSYTTQLGYTSSVTVSKISPVGDLVLWSQRFSGRGITGCNGGSSCDFVSRYTDGTALAVDASGNVYLLGNTDTTDLATSGAYKPYGIGPFLAKIKADGSAVAWLTYLGTGNTGLQAYHSAASPLSSGRGLAVDKDGNCIIAGSTSDPNFPITAGAFRTKPGSAFVAKISADGARLIWSTYLDSSGGGTALALDPSGNAWVTGVTADADFPNANGWSQGGDFLIALEPTASALRYSARYPDQSVSRSIAIDGFGLVHVAGQSGTVSVIAPDKAPSRKVFGIANAANGPVAGRIAPGEVISIYGPGVGPDTPASYQGNSSSVVPKSLGGVQVTINGILSPLLYVSANQINAVVPFGLAQEPSVNQFVYPDSAIVQVASNSAMLPDFKIPVTRAVPEVFRSSVYYAAALNEDESVNSSANPASLGSIVTVWVTGTALSSSQDRKDGSIQVDAYNTYCCTVSVYSSVTASSPTPAQVIYSGQAPGMVAGISQINFRLPSQIAPGMTMAYMTVSSANQVSNAVRIYVKN
jgi:uncharacterized protein (TIGR03437 family)